MSTTTSACSTARRSEEKGQQALKEMGADVVVQDLSELLEDGS